MKLLFLLFLATIFMSLPTSVAADDAVPDTFTLLHSLANPNEAMGFREDAVGVTLPDSEAISDTLTAAQEKEIIQQTVKSADTMVQGVYTGQPAQDVASQRYTRAPGATRDPQVDFLIKLANELAPVDD